MADEDEILRFAQDDTDRRLMMMPIGRQQEHATTLHEETACQARV